MEARDMSVKLVENIFWHFQQKETRESLFKLSMMETTKLLLGFYGFEKNSKPLLSQKSEAPAHPHFLVWLGEDLMGHLGLNLDGTLTLSLAWKTLKRGQTSVKKSALRALAPREAALS